MRLLRGELAGHAEGAGSGGAVVNLRGNDLEAGVG